MYFNIYIIYIYIKIWYIYINEKKRTTPHDKIFFYRKSRGEWYVEIHMHTHMKKVCFLYKNLVDCLKVLSKTQNLYISATLGMFMVNSGYGFKVSDAVLIGGLVLAGYVAYKLISPVSKGLGDSASGVGDAISGVGEGIKDISGAGSGVVTGGFGIISNAERLIVGAENTAGNIVTGILTGGNNNAAPTPLTNISPAQNEINTAQAAAYYSGGTYNANTGVLTTAAGQGYSVRPAEVSNVIRQTSYTNARTGSVVTRGAGSILAGKGFN